MTAKITGVVSYSMESWYHKPWNPGILPHGILRFDDVPLVSYGVEYPHSPFLQVSLARIRLVVGL